MTVRKFGQGRWRAALPLAIAMIAVGTATPIAAQQAESPAPTPAPSSTFRLPPADDGRAPGVQGPSDNGLPPVAPNESRGSPPAPTPTPTPSPTRPVAPPQVTPTQPRAAAPAPTTAPTVVRPGAPAAASRTAPSSSDSAPAQDSPGSAVLPTLQNAAPAAEADAPALAPAPADVAPTAAAAPDSVPTGTPIWAWLLAGLAALGAGLWYWRRRSALAGPVIDEVAAPRAAPPAPPPRPAAPVAPVRPAEPRSASPLVNRAAGERRAVVGMALDIRGIRFAPDQVVVAFSLHLINQGILPATGLMVRIALNQGSAMPEAVLGRFFDGAGGSVLRDDMTLDAGAGEELSTEVMLPRAAIEPLMIGGKPMLVPVIAFDVTYHWDGEGDAFGQNAGSFVLGREQGASGSEKLAPLPLDRASYQVDAPGARATAVKRAQ